MPNVLLEAFFFFFNDTATTEIYTLSLHDALPICAWKEFLVSAPIDAKPVVAGGNASLALNEVVAASSLFSVTDADNDTMTEYQFWDSTAAPASAHFSVNGTAQSANHAVDVMASNLPQVNVVGGSVAGTDQLWVRTNDGAVWSDWYSFMAVTHA